MSRPPTGMDISHLPKLQVKKALSNQTYYKRKKDLGIIYEQLELLQIALEKEEDPAQRESLLQTVEAYTAARNAIILRLQQADRPIPTLEDFIQKTQIQLDKDGQVKATLTIPNPNLDESVDNLLRIFNSTDGTVKDAAQQKLLDAVRKVNERESPPVSPSTLEVETKS